jgi:RHS repeat-associated protein
MTASSDGGAGTPKHPDANGAGKGGERSGCSLRRWWCLGRCQISPQLRPGQVIDRSDYLPFGDTLNQSGALPKQRFTGQERDGEAGLDDFNARSLQMRTGRMNRPDPVFGDALTSPQRWNRTRTPRTTP